MAKRNFGFLTKTEREFIAGIKPLEPSYKKVANYRLKKVYKKLLAMGWLDFFDDVRLMLEWAEPKPHLAELNNLASFKLLQDCAKWGTRKQLPKNILGDRTLPQKIDRKQKQAITEVVCPNCNHKFLRTYRLGRNTSTTYGVKRSNNSSSDKIVPC